MSLNAFIHVYSPRAGTDNPLGTKFWCQQKALITLPICCQFKKKLFEVWFFSIFYVLFHIAPGRGRQPTGDKNFMTTERPFLFAHMLQVSKWSLQNLILYTFLMILYMCIYPQGKGIQPLGDKLLMSTGSPYHFDHLLQVSNKSIWILILYTFFNVFPQYIALGQGQTTLCGQNPDVNRKALSLCPFVASLQKISLKSDFIYNFSCFYTWI